MKPHERNAALIGAGTAAFLIAVVFYLAGSWGLWVTVLLLIPAGGFGAVNDPDG